MKNIYLVIVSLIVFSCGSKPQNKDITPTHDNFKIASKHVNETRVINVWTPPSYNNNTHFYTVLYMPDGGIKEDFPHIANTIAKLVKAKSIPPIILVGIENTKRGRDLTGFSKVEKDKQYCPLTDGATNFRNFITEELASEIKKRYRITEKKGVIGESLAGLFVMETFLQKPNAFDFYIAMDPSLWWNDGYLVKNASTLLSKNTKKNTKLWFAGSSAEGISKYTIALEKILQESAPNNLTWKYTNEPSQQHNTIFRATKESAIKWVLKE